MREAGKLVAEALRLCRDMAQARRAHHRDRSGRRGASTPATVPTPLFKGYPGANPKVPFPACTCISLNEQVVHGIPGQREIRDGDLRQDRHRLQAQRLVRRRGHHHPGRQRPARNGGGWCEVAEQVLQIAIDEMPRRRWWSEIAAQMQRHAEDGRLQRGRAVRRPRHRPDHAREPAGAQLRQPRDCASTTSAWSRAWCWRSSRWSTWARPTRACSPTTGPS